jgi:tRNA (mo5U34)-methyltransferase
MQTTNTLPSNEDLIASVPFWFHSLDLGGIVTNGHKSAKQLAWEWNRMRVPSLEGKSVLDVNTWDGYFAFQAEQAGAAFVTGLDFYMWAMDQREHQRYWRECMASGVIPAPYEQMPYFKPAELPGKNGFDVAREVLRSGVRPVVADFATINLSAIGTYDVVFFLGSLYHMRDPMDCLKRVACVTKELAVIETEAIMVRGHERSGLCEFFEPGALNSDISNWWAPNVKALRAMCLRAGFRGVELVAGAGIRTRLSLGRIRRFRAVVHAWK